MRTVRRPGWSCTAVSQRRTNPLPPLVWRLHQEPSQQIAGIIQVAWAVLGVVNTDWRYLVNREQVTLVGGLPLTH